MANYTTLNAYDAMTAVPEFRGLSQFGGGFGNDPRYAAECENVDTREGIMTPAALCEPLEAVFTRGVIGTLAVLNRRWYSGDNARIILVAAAGGHLYHLIPGAPAWAKLELPVGWEGERYQSDVWSWLAYEINPEGAENPIDVLLLTNAKDGMIMVRGDTMTVSAVATPKKFGVIERHAERIWGGAIDGSPDTLVYSAPYDPTNWESTPEIPEDGAGDIQQPSWDGDRFTALRAFGTQLVAFKKHRIWRVTGSNPGEYSFSEQFGGGAAYPATIAVQGERIYMLTPQGIAVYDGLSVSPYYQGYARGVFKRMTLRALSGAVACIWKDRYYCALPLDGSTVNNAVLVYNLSEDTWLLRTDVSVSAFLPTPEELYYTCGLLPENVFRWRDSAWDTQRRSDARTRWVSPWLDYGQKKMTKGGFTVYITPEAVGEEALLSVSIETETKIKAKSVIVPHAEDGRYPVRKVRFGGAGRRFRFIISSPRGGGVWRLIGGVTVVADIDSD